MQLHNVHGSFMSKSLAKILRAIAEGLINIFELHATEFVQHNFIFHACRWDLLQVFFILYMAAMVPVRVGFDFVATGAMFWFEGMVDLYFWTDIVVNFLTAFVDEEGKLVLNLVSIEWNYLTGWFPVDFLAIFPMDYVAMASQVRIVLRGARQPQADSLCRESWLTALLV
jgi:hypothetical protein